MNTVQNGKRINTVQKGRRIEKMARQSLEKEGYLVDQKTRSSFHSPDFFGLFDLFCLKHSLVRLIQIKSSASSFYTTRKEIREWMSKNRVLVQCEIWLYLGRGKWRKEQFDIHKLIDGSYETTTIRQ